MAARKRLAGLFKDKPNSWFCAGDLDVRKQEAIVRKEFVDPLNTHSGSKVRAMAKLVGKPNLKTMR